MELYRIIATIANTSTTFQLAYLPENFEGIKINQNFSFVNPIGFNPKFSVDTMRIILTDKNAIDSAFDTYGLQARVVFAISKLNASGIGYTSIGTNFEIDFESYEKFDEYSEFALKSISAMDRYNRIKDTEIKLNLLDNSVVPNTQNFINYLSVKSKSVHSIDGTLAIIQFEKNNESKIFNNDTALIEEITLGVNTVTDADIYNVNSETESGYIDMSIAITGKIKYTVNNTTSVNITLCVIDRETGVNGAIISFAPQFVFAGTHDFNFANTINNLHELLSASTAFFFKIETDTADISFPKNGTNMFVDFKVSTDFPVVGQNDFAINYMEIFDVFQNIFNYQATVQMELRNIGLTSAQAITKLENFAILKPKDFISDFCKATGSIMNFKRNGDVEFKYINTYFNELLTAGNAIEIQDFKDLSIKYFNELNYSSVSVGCNPKDYDVYSYMIDWNKILTFNQTGRIASENLDLSLSKLRTDFSGILECIYKRSRQTDEKNNDIYIFRPDFPLIAFPETVTPEIYVYDDFNPRYMLMNWGKFLSFGFQNFGLNTLTISSNGGTTDNLNIYGTNQMDNFTLSQTPRLLPIQYDFTCNIDDVDFQESILKINHNGEDVYLFVFNAETTDRFSEQKISGLKIQF